jgi:effector-binding domain-containing protein
MPVGAVEIVDVDRRPTAVVVSITDWKSFPDVWRRSLGQVYAVLPASHDRLNVMLYRDDRPHAEVGVLLDPASKDFSGDGTGEVVASALPNGRVATIVHRGPYSELGTAHERVVEHCRAAGLQLTGVRWEIYGHGDEDPPQTEISWLLRD